MRTGTAEILDAEATLKYKDGTKLIGKYLDTWATQTDGSTQASEGDSGGGSFIEINGENYLIGIMGAVGVEGLEN